MEHMKTCSRCGFTKDSIIGFYKSKTGGPAHICKDCHKKRMSDLRRDDPSIRIRDRERSKHPKRIEMARNITKLWRISNPEAYKAQTAVGNALRDKRILREPCSICSSTENIHAHHKDYSKPLDVIWLCARCHHRIHALFPELEGNNKTYQAS